MKIGIVGAGAIGVSAALALQRRGYTVKLFDQGEPGGGASSGNSGIIATSEVIPFNRPETLRALPGMLLDPRSPLSVRALSVLAHVPWFARFALASLPANSARATHQLALLLASAGAAWREIVKDTDAAPLLVSKGWLKVHSNPQSLAAGWRLAEMQAEFGIESQLLSASAMRSLEPALAAGLAGAVFYPEVMSLRSPLRAIELLAQHFVSNGGTFTHDQVSAISQTGTAVIIETANAGRHVFERVVLACGAWSGRLASMLGEQVNLKTERGYHSMLTHPPITLTRPVTVSSPGYTMAPMIDGLRIASGVEIANLTAPAEWRRIRAMARHAATIVGGLDSAPLSEWLGCRPSMPDSIPVLRYASAANRVVLAFGHGHLGVTLGPSEANRIAALIDTCQR